MILFFKRYPETTVYAVEVSRYPSDETTEKLCWLLGDAELLTDKVITGQYIGPRREMITPWSTNAVEITQNMGIENIKRIENFGAVPEGKEAIFDPMLQALYQDLDQSVYTINKQADPIIYINDIANYNISEGLALSEDEVAYLEEVSQKIGRKLTDSEVFGFSQVNSEHCRHKIFNGQFIIDGREMPDSLFSLIKKTSQANPNRIVSAYKDNVAFVKGPKARQFAPHRQDKADIFAFSDHEMVISLKAETHNFPTTVEPFNGAATGSGGEIRDRMAGGKGSMPIAGTAVYMTAYSRTEQGRCWENAIPSRPWLYQSPEEILIKASNGASDFGNKFGQPLICGSLLTFEHSEQETLFAYDKVIMLAGGVGYGMADDSLKSEPEPGDLIIVMGGDNYRIGMGGGAVSSVATGEYDTDLELNAVQRANPEMQKRVYNAIRALCESTQNPIISIHDHGAGGHLNSLSELVENTGGTIYLHKLPIGDPTLSAKEIIGNESQERMGLLLKKKHLNLLKAIAERERAPMYVVGEVSGDMVFRFEDENGKRPIDLDLAYLFGKPPQTILTDQTQNREFEPLKYNPARLQQYVENVLQLEAVACKDWLTNKVDRSVTGRVATQQCTGEIQLPLNDAGVVALDYTGTQGIATSIGHAPVSALIDPAAGSVLSIAEALTNLVWAPLDGSLEAVSLSANWMWPAKNKGEDARLYAAVEAASNFAIALGINIPTGKDSLSMTQKYPDGQMVYAPGTVIISSVGQVTDVRKTITPDLIKRNGTSLIYIDFSGDDWHLGGSSFAQMLNLLGREVANVKNAAYFKTCFDCIQTLIKEDALYAGHDISAGGMITTLLEMAFPTQDIGLEIDLTQFREPDIFKLLFSEKPGVIIQAKDKQRVIDLCEKNKLRYALIGETNNRRVLQIAGHYKSYDFDIDYLRDIWFKSSYLLDRKQSGEIRALERFNNYKSQALTFRFANTFTGTTHQYGIVLDRRVTTGVKAAIIREKGVNGDREMAYAMHLAGFDVKDIHMTDLISGREDLSDVHFIVYVGGFSNSDVMGSAKGWAGAFLHNPKAKAALDHFYQRNDTLSLGVCNGCQLMLELNLIYPLHKEKALMQHNDSHKFESAFLTVDIAENNSVMLSSLQGARLGIWVAHGEGKFSLPYEESRYHLPMKYAYDEYPANPNGSDYSTAALCSDDGRHLAMMPHLERAIFPWQWAYYPDDRAKDIVSPWIEAFVNARRWIDSQSHTHR